jgi:hypothetical protein
MGFQGTRAATFAGSNVVEGCKPPCVERPRAGSDSSQLFLSFGHCAYNLRARPVGPSAHAHWAGRGVATPVP